MSIVKEHGGLEGIDITDRGYFTGFPDIADRNSIQAFTQLAAPLKGNTAFRTDEIRERFRARQRAKRESERRRS